MGLKRPVDRSECIDGPRPCPWFSCKHNLHIDVTDAGGIIFNHGRKVERGVENRPRNTERRLPIVGARKNHKYRRLFEENTEKLLEDFEGSSESNCLLDLVKDGRSYTLEETGDRLNITRERVRQIESKGIRMMKARSATLREHDE